MQMLDDGSDDFHTLGLLHTWPGMEWLEENIRGGVFRAGAQFVTGRYAGFVVSTSGPGYPDAAVSDGAPRSLASGPGVRLAICTEENRDEFPCNAGAISPIDEALSYLAKDRVVVLAVVELVKASRTTFVESVRSESLVADARSACAFVYGMGCGKDAVIEVVAPTIGAAHARLEELLSSPAVACADVMHTVGDLTRGFAGEELA